MRASEGVLCVGLTPFTTTGNRHLNRAFSKHFVAKASCNIHEQVGRSNILEIFAFVDFPCLDQDAVMVHVDFLVEEWPKFMLVVADFHSYT